MFRRSAPVSPGAVCAALAALLAAAPAARATTLLKLEPFAGAAPVVVAPIETAGTAAAFHGFDGTRATPGFALAPDTAHWYLHRSTTTGALSLGLVLSGATGVPWGEFDFLLSGAPAGAKRVVEDDLQDVYGWSADGTADGVFDFAWGRPYTDGFVLGGLEDGTWRMTVEIDHVQGALSGVFVSGAPGAWTTMAMAAAPGEGFALSRAEVVALQVQALPAPAAGATPVPLPGAAGLLAAGLGAVAALRRRRARA